MANVNIPDELVAKIKEVLPQSGSTQQFVVDAVREKLAWRQRREEFYRLSDATKQAMAERGLSERDVLDDFEAFRDRLGA
jgi:hypothetical protein